MASAAPVNARYHISVLATSTVDSKPSLLVTFDNARYLFNSPESISRICVQSKIALRKVGAVFLGDLEESAGLPGLILSTVEAGNNKVQICGPAGTTHFVASCRFFTRRDKLSLGITECTASPQGTVPALPPPIFADSNLSVHAFALSATSSEQISPLSSSSATSAGLKRKRSRSQATPSPPPRSKAPPGQADQSAHSGTIGFDPTSPTFNPTHLRGDHAALWRSMVVADMFRGRVLTSATAKEGLVAIQNAGIQSGRRSISPAYLPYSLPPPSDTPRQPTALSYLVIGPALRGRFQPEEAQKRGVKPGAAFKKLIAGQRVWVSETASKAAVVATNDVAKKKESKKERAERHKREKEEQALIVDGEGEGSWVDPCDCMTPGQPAKAFLVLNIPDTRYLDSLPEISPQSCTNLPDGAELRTVFYFLGPGVLVDERLSAYMKALDAASDTQFDHRISSPDITNHNPITFVPSALLTLRLSYLDSEIFSLPKYSFLTDAADAAKHLPPSLPSRASVLSANDRYNHAHEPVQRESGVDFRNFDFAVPSKEATEEAGRLKGSEKSEEVLLKAKEAWERFVPHAEASRQAVSEMVAAQDKTHRRPGSDIKVTPLGTGSAIPSKYRNVSSTLLHLPEGGYVLLDAGEGTWGQLARRFGESGAEEVLSETKLLFISHMHQDHHAGLATLLRRRAKLTTRPNDPLVIVAPSNARLYLQEQQALFELGLHGREQDSDIFFIDSGALEFSGRPLADTDWRAHIVKDLYTRLGLKQVATVPVLHRCRCWGIVIEHTSGWKVVFSGDTMPCEALAVAGRGASLLIHEATIQDDMPEVALAKGHSTFAQAIDIARRMRTQHLLLTHFSARYPKLPPLSHASAETNGVDVSGPGADSDKIEPVIAVAFDMATMRLDEFWKMEQYRQPAMDTLFAWDEDTEPVTLSLEGEVTDAAVAAAEV